MIHEIMSMNLENIMLTEKSQSQKISFCVIPIPKVVQWKRIRLPMQDILETEIHRFNPWVRKIPWRRKWQPTTIFLVGKF